MRTATERLQTAIAALPPGDAPFAVLRIGMDDFRIVNETHGVAVGDEVLDLAERRLQAAIREHEVVVRLPGDEFAVLLHPVESVIRAGSAADRLNDLLQRVYLVQGEVVNITACLGVALAPEDGRQAELLLQRAGAALQCAKASGQGMVQFFEPAMEENRRKRHSLSLDLRKALLLHQFEVHYQPQVDVQSQALTGFEALLRWHHPELGMIPPAEFVPLAEETGLMGMIGDWVLRTACEEAARLPEGLVMAVNASPVQFKNGLFARSVEAALHRAGISGDRLEVEITEGLLLRNEAVVVSAMNHLHTMKVRLAMDDFGTGYSSLGQLARLPFDKIKIDRSLVGGTSKERAIVRAIATLGQGIGMATLAEGIETTTQLAHAEADGCSEAQGYLFGRAVPASELQAIVARFGPQNQTTIVGASRKMSETIYQILYCSRNRIQGTAAEVKAQIEAILRSSRVNNARAGVTGALFYNSIFFAQALEGTFAEVQRTFERLQLDPRHSDLVVLQSGYVAAREFGTWSMAYAGEGADFQMSVTGADTRPSPSELTGEQVSSFLRGVVVQQENWALPSRTAWAG